MRLPPTFTDEGLRAAIEARRQIPGLPVLVLSQYVEQLYARELMSDRARRRWATCSRTGSRTSTSSSTLSGRSLPAAPLWTPTWSVRYSPAAPPTPPLELTPREYEVLSLMAEGRSNAAIAARMFVTEKTVSKHSNNIFTKLGLKPSEDDNRRILAVLAYLEG